MIDKPKAVVLCGPTGIGKTDVSIEIAGRFNGEIIGADSMQIYRFMDVGTAKPSPEERARLPHHMIDIVDPDQPFDAAAYAKGAGGLVRRRFHRGILPFVVGGTGLYIKALIYGLIEKQTANASIRKRLKETAERRGTAYLYDQLCRADPAAVRKIHGNDTYRIVRALEVHRLTGIGISDHHRRHRFAVPRFDVLKIGLTMDRARLYDRINRRVDGMIAAGFVDEVQTLLSRGYSEDLKSMRAIGYRRMTDVVKNRLTLEEAAQIVKRDTRRYAKRQLTWFRADPEMFWFEPEETDRMIRSVESFIIR